MSLKERVRAIGGTLDIDSAPGKGCRHTLKVPLKADTVSDPQKPEMRINRQHIIQCSTEAHASEIRVLFADDHKVMRQGLVGLVAQKPDIEVAGEAADGKEALELARKLVPDVVVMDIVMPQMDGIEATRRIKAELPEVRVIGLSMFDDEDAAQKMREAGADAFVSKSGSSAELLKAIYHLTGKDRNEDPSN